MKRLSQRVLAALLGVACVAAAGVGPKTAYAQSYPPATPPDPNPNAQYFNPCFDNANGTRRGNHELTIVVITPQKYLGTQPDGTPGFDALWAQHAQFMKSTHGAFLISYSLNKGAQLSNPLDPSSAPTGNTMYVLNECYQSHDDISYHWTYTAANWEPGFNQLIALMQKPDVTVVTLHDGQVEHAMWGPNLLTLPPPILY